MTEPRAWVLARSQCTIRALWLELVKTIQEDHAQAVQLNSATSYQHSPPPNETHGFVNPNHGNGRYFQNRLDVIEVGVIVRDSRERPRPELFVPYWDPEGTRALLQSRTDGRTYEPWELSQTVLGDVFFGPIGSQ